MSSATGCMVVLAVVASMVGLVLFYFYFRGSFIVSFVSVDAFFFFSFDYTWLLLYQYMPGILLLMGLKNDCCLS
jgi:hypothetical protein